MLASPQFKLLEATEARQKWRKVFYGEINRIGIAAPAAVPRPVGG